jgi:hypothetical protein
MSMVATINCVRAEAAASTRRPADGRPQKSSVTAVRSGSNRGRMTKFI